MQLRRLQLKNHRNYRFLDLEPGPGVNVFIGANGQGKTNLLEAVAMLALSSSPRARRDLELVGPVGPGAKVLLPKVGADERKSSGSRDAGRKTRQKSAP